MSPAMIAALLFEMRTPAFGGGMTVKLVLVAVAAVAIIALMRRMGGR